MLRKDKEMKEIKILVSEHPRLSKRGVKLCNMLHNEFLKQGMNTEDDLLAELLDNQAKNAGKKYFMYPKEDELLIKEFVAQYLLKKENGN